MQGNDSKAKRKLQIEAQNKSREREWINQLSKPNQKTKGKERK